MKGKKGKGSRHKCCLQVNIESCCYVICQRKLKTETENGNKGYNEEMQRRKGIETEILKMDKSQYL